MTSSESPTHPDAPRAGGETPPLDVEACVRLLESLASEGEDLYADAGAAALLSTVAAALRGIEKDRADAARWRFWRPRYLAADFDYGEPPVPVVVFRLPTRFAVGADPDLTTDVLIDADRSAKPEVDVMQAEIAIYFSEVERLRASLLERHRDGERLDRPAPSEKSCLVCGQVRPFAVWHGPSGAGVCQQCRDARHALRGGATMETPKTHDEFMAALDRIIQHYLGDHGARYGDARFVLDYALSLEDEIQRLRASRVWRASK